MRIKHWHWLGPIATTLLATACATATPAPTNLMVESRAAVRVAEQSGAHRDPHATEYLALARAQITEAQRFIAVGSHQAARRVLEAAQINAEMAGELAREANARAEADATRRGLDQLKARTQ